MKTTIVLERASARYVQSILEATAAHFDIEPWEVQTVSKRGPVSRARQWFVQALRSTLNLSYPMLAAILRVDHSSLVRGQKIVAGQADAFGEWLSTLPKPSAEVVSEVKAMQANVCTPHKRMRICPACAKYKAIAVYGGYACLDCGNRFAGAATVTAK